jgi:hypothetical protein
MITQSALTRLALGTALAVGTASLASAQDSGPLLDALVRKGILTDQEAEDLRADLVRDFGFTSPGKLDVSSSVTRLRIAGDARVRYQYDNEKENPSSDNRDRNRFRYRLRFGATASLGPKWSAGFRMETNNSATSTNNDLGGNAATPGSTTSVADNFSKNGDGVYFGQVFVQFNDTQVFGAENVDVRLGKFSHKFFNPGVNGFWIDSDINFEGIAEEALYEDVAGTVDLGLRAGHFILANNASSTTDRNVSPSLLHMVQLEVSDLKAGAGWRVAPTLVTYSAPSTHDNVTGAALRNDNNIYSDLTAIIVPAEYVFNLRNGMPLAVYGTYGVNLEGDDRARRLAGSASVDDSDHLFNAGLRYGSNKLAGEYQITGEYRYVGNGSYSSFLLDSDFNGGYLNGQGFILSGSYNLTEAVATTVTYFNSFNIENNRAFGGSTNRGNGYGEAQVLQIDLSAKF